MSSLLDPASTTECLAEQVVPLHRRARVTLTAFVITFLCARVLVLLIMTGMLPARLFLHVSGTHVHHLNYGLFLLCGICGWTLFVPRPFEGKTLRNALLAYGIALALIFDEFGMWLHLGGGYWQRASYDAVIVVSSLLALFAFAPSLRRWRPQHWGVTLVIACALLVLIGLLVQRLNKFGRSLGPWLEQLELNGPQ